MSMDTESRSLDYRFRGRLSATLSKGLLGLSIASLTLGIFLGYNHGDNFLHFKFSYLVTFAFFASITLGGLFFVLVQHLANYRHATVFRRITEQVMMTLPLILLLGLPIVLFWLEDLYSWARPEAANDLILQKKSPFLNKEGFIIRYFVYFVIWLILAVRMYHLSIRQDTTGDPKLKLSMRRISAPGMLLFAVTLTLAAMDWLMSLDPHWYSTIWGVYFFAGCLLGVFSTVAILCIVINRSGVIGKAINENHFHDLGKLMFAFVVFWAYIGFSQLVLIWMANIPEETLWFAHRWLDPGWKAYSIFLLVGHFIIPFCLLLSRTVKRFYVTLALASVWVLIMHYIDMYWLVMPSQPDAGHHVPLTPMDLFIWLGIGALYASWLIQRLQSQPLVPLRDPHLADSLAFENA
jgi:glucan phosphoethanolaminetransferase (alkaline phosphatase superfamily)